MTIEEALRARAASTCEFCGNDDALSACDVPASPTPGVESSVLACATCAGQLESPDKLDPNHWRCLSVSMWSEVPAVQVMAWRTLTHLSAESWARDLAEQLYLEDEVLAWARAGVQDAEEALAIRHLDSNGVQLATGDTVTLTKDLVVKGAGFTAKRGTAVRGIALVADNAEHVEGRVNGQQIVILTQFVKKSG